MTKIFDDDDPAVTAADRAVWRAMLTGEGCRRIDADELQALAQQAQQIKAVFEARFSGMTRAQAIYVRQLRCDQGYTWRAVAEACALEWSGDWGSHQLAGMTI
jgi:hypothetical protein